MYCFLKEAYQIAELKADRKDNFLNEGRQNDFQVVNIHLYSYRM